MKKNILLVLFSVVISASLIFPQDKTETRSAELTPYTSEYQYQNTGTDAIWDIQNMVDPGAESGALGNAGLEFDGTYYYTTRWASNLIHKYDIDGFLVEEFSIPGVSGLRDLAYDGTYFYGGASSTSIYEMDFATKTLISTITVSGVNVRNIAYDSGSNGFWCGNWSDPPTLFDRTGTQLNSIATGLLGQYGSAYDNVSAGGPYLWVFDQTAGGAVVHQFDIATGTATGLTHDVESDAGVTGTAGGMFTAPDHLTGTFSLGVLIQADRVVVYELGGSAAAGPGLATLPNPTWFDTNVDLNQDLSWANPGGATSIEVFFGTNPASLTSIYSGAPIPTYDPGTMAFNTTYYWYVNETVFGSGTTVGFLWSFTTAAAPATLPYSENFEGGTLPVGWGGDMYVSSGHGTAASYGLTANLYSAGTSNFSSNTLIMGLVTAGTVLEFDYRIVNWSGYPGTATTLGADYFNINISTDGGATYTTEYIINSGNHITSTDFANISLDLGTYIGSDIVVQWDLYWDDVNAADYYFDIDNVFVGEPILGINPPVGLQASITGMDVGLTWLAPPDNTLRWDDGPNVNAIGVGGGTWEVASRFDASITGPLTGKELRAMEMYINASPTPPDNITIKIYDQGTATFPGTLLYSEDVTSQIVVNTWNAITLSSVLTLSGNDIWIGYEMTGGDWPAGVDAGATIDGCWTTLDGGVTWDRLSDFGFDNDWNLAGFVYDAGPLGSQPTQFVLNSNAGTDTKSLNKGTLNSGMLTSVKQVKYGNDYQNHLGRQIESKFKQNFVNDGIDATLTGYNVYRDGAPIATTGVSVLFYDDLALPYGNYSYTVTAQYVEGESDPAGPVVVNHVNPNHITILVDPLSATYWTGHTEGTIKTDGEINTALNSGWAVYDVSAIPVGAIIVSINFNGYVNATNWPYWSVTPMGSVDPVNDDAATINDQIALGYGSLDAYIYRSEGSTFPTGWVMHPMVNTAASDLGAALAQGWFATGFYNRDQSATYFINFDGHSQTNPPYLEIVYMNPPTLPVFSITPDTKDFGFAFNGTSSADQTFTITNVGAGTLTINSGDITLVGTDADQFVLTDGNIYPIDLLNSESATVDVKFSPTSMGAKTADLQIVDNMADATHTIPLSGLGGATLPYAENFDGFTSGLQVACQDPINWTTWSNLPCDPVEDAYISSNYAFSGTNSAVFVQNNDVIKPFGAQTSGKWDISFMVYIPTGKSGYFNVMAEALVLWDIEVYFDAGGGGRALTGDPDEPFTWTEDTWQQVQIVVDLDTDAAEFWFDGSLVKSWAWTNGTSGACPLVLDVADIFGATANDEMYIDDFEFSQFGGTTFPLDVTVMDGWNMVSIPGTHPTNDDVTTWWPNLSGDVFAFTGNYTSVTTVVPGAGYWLNNSGAETYSYPEINIVPHDPITVPAGWSMIGGYENIAPVSGLIPSAGTILSVFEFGTGYATATDLVPGYGYWINMSEAGTITIPDPSPLPKGSGEVVEYFKEDWGKIIITDNTGRSYTLYAVKGDVNLNKYELPPMPPVGMFDIRYGSDRVAEDISSSTQSIDMSGIAYPITVRVEGMDIRLQDVTGTQIDEKMKSGGEITISNAQINKLMVSGELIPDIYALEQNYPNPFNPSTVIEFSLPEDVSNVQLTIYDVLGQRVAQLVNTSLKAGKYQYQWNAGTVSTGMYIYELRTDKFVSVKKMVLMK